VEPPTTVVVRLGGQATALAPRTARIEAVAGSSAEILSDDDAERYWSAVNVFSWRSFSPPLFLGGGRDGGAIKAQGESSPLPASPQGEGKERPRAAKLIKVPITAVSVAALDERLGVVGAVRRYSVAANVAWIAWPDTANLDDLNHALTELKLSGLMILGNASEYRLGIDPGRSLAQRVQRALDPANRFAGL
jgi:hypothetical protein